MTTTMTPCSPRFATTRTTERKTLGGQVAKISKGWLGVPLMPWQRQVCDITQEIDPATGRLAYREVILTVPRQSGKTTLILSLILHRAFAPHFGGRQSIRYTAQTGKDAKEKWQKDYLDSLAASALQEDRDYKVSNQTGHEGMLFVKPHSRFALIAGTKKSGHGGTIDEAFLDEAFAQVDGRIEQALKPAMVTRPQPQLWIVSTAGDSTSTYLRAKVDRGRELAMAGVNRGVAYFEWSAHEDADPADPATWWSCMPALGLTQPEEAIAADFNSMDLPEFRRAYLNQWVDGHEDSVIDVGMWQQLGDDGDSPSAQVGSQVAVSVEIAPDRSCATIAVAGWRTSDGIPQVEITDQRPGTSWIVGRLLDILSRLGDVPVVIDPTGPVGAIVPSLEDRDIRLVRLQTREIGAACGALYDRYMDGSLRHLGDPRLSVAVASSYKRNLGTEGWRWDRRTKAVDISPLVASTYALWGLLNSDTPIEMSVW